MAQQDTQTGDKFTPVRFHFDKATDENRFYIYSIRNREKEKFYIGISQHPARRINEQLKSKKHLSDDYAKAAYFDLHNDPDNHIFEYGLLNENGYSSALLGCIAEVAYMIHLEKHGVEIYNQNKFGAHPALVGDDKQAFYAIVKIIDNKTNTLPSNDEMIALEKAIPKIRQYVEDTNDNDIINTELLQSLQIAWKEHKERMEHHIFGAPQISEIPTDQYLPNHHRLIPVDANDNDQDLLFPDIDTLRAALGDDDEYSL